MSVLLVTAHMHPSITIKARLGRAPLKQMCSNFLEFNLPFQAW
jgi:metallophosphoesterase superfamily enzyme